MAKKGKKPARRPIEKTPAKAHASKERATTKSRASKKKDTQLELPLGRQNYILIAIGFVIIVLGFILMSGKENIYSFRKITLSVIFIIFGYAFEIYAIMKRPKKNEPRNNVAY